MTEKVHTKVLILGAGPAGLTAALYAARADLAPVVLTGMVPYGQAALTNLIENYPGFPEGIGGTELGQLFEKQAVNFGAEVVYEQAESVDLSVRPFEVRTFSTTYQADTIILSLGASSRRLGVPGEKLLTGRGVSYCATCDGWFHRGKDIHIVGGGDSAMEEALFLTRFANSVTVIHRRNELRAGAILEKRAKANPKISFIWDTVVKEVIGEENVTALKIENRITGETSTIPSDGVFVFIGHDPNSQMLKGQVELLVDGTVKIDENMMTSVPGVFAAGEIADNHYRQVVTSAGMGAAAAIQATYFLDE